MMARVALPPSVDLWMGRGRTFWDGRSGRERTLLSGLASVLALCLVVMVVLRPLMNARETARGEIQLYDSLAARLRAAGPDLKAPATGAARSATVQSIVTTTAGESALQIRQIEPEGPVTHVVLEAVDFTRLVQWLDRLERDFGLTAASARIERQIAPGVVNARLSLVRR